MKVCKFGGTSVASAEKIRQIIAIVRADLSRRIVVVSAPGKRSSGDTKVTDLLIALAKECLAGGDGEQELVRVVDRYREIAEGLGLGAAIVAEIEADLRSRVAHDRDPEWRASAPDRARFLDSVKAAGEDNCAKLVAAAMSAAGLEAQYVSPADAGLLVSDEYGNGRVLPESYMTLAALADRPGITVFPGFFGHSPDGHVVTLPRGGSDVTGAVLAAAVKADVYENFTDVESVFAANPAVVGNPQAIPVLTYREMRELSYAGFSVLHDESLEPVHHARVPVNVKSTNNPTAEGTWIVPARHEAPGAVVGIAGSRGFCTVFVSKYLMNREVGFGRKLLQIIEEHGLPYEHMPSGIDNISVILEEEGLTPALERQIIARIHEVLEPDQVSVEHDLALVMVVGEGMRHTLGLAGRTMTALAEAGINVEMINQGSSEVSMMIGVKGADADKAVRALYHKFFSR